MAYSAAIVDLEPILRAQLFDASASFSVGAFGAVAEFFHDKDEARCIHDPAPLTLATERGATRIDLRDDIYPVAYETLSSRKDCWLHGIAFCLPSHDATGAGRTSVTELGSDAAAIRACDRGALLFDMGLGTANVDFCVRTHEPELIADLRATLGRSPLAPGNMVMEKILAASPHRVVSSRLGRVEVYQAIGKHKTPQGPHTHLLPKLLRTRRTHDAKIPIPQGYLPCLNLFPASPLFDTLGRPKLYDPASHAAFEALLAKWARSAYTEQKRRVQRSLQDLEDPASFRYPDTRLERTAVRIALRQLAREDALRETAALWRERFDHD